jgi:hypothetical protein
MFSNKKRHMCLNEYSLAGVQNQEFKALNYLLVPPEITIQSSLTRFSSQILLNCTIIARPLTSAKWKQNRIEIKNNIKRIEINDYTIQLILSLQVNFSSQETNKEIFCILFQRSIYLITQIHMVCMNVKLKIN